MNIRDHANFAPMRVALVALAAAGVYALWALAGALRLPNVPAVGARPVSALALSPIATRPPADIAPAVDGDLFSPDRQPPDEPFRMPGETVADDGPHTTVRPTVLGTAVAPDGFSFATVVLAGMNHPRIVHRGDQVGEFTVQTIERGHVVFTTATGARVDIAATAATTQESANVPFNMLPPAADSGADSYFGRGAARRRGRPTRDPNPPG
jgi:hypothetical protein